MTVGLFHHGEGVDLFDNDINAEGAPRACLALHGDLPIHHARILLADGQTQSGPFRLHPSIRLLKGAEQLCHILGGNAGTRVRNLRLQAYPAAGRRFRIDPLHDAPFSGELYGISQYIGKHLSELRLIPCHVARNVIAALQRKDQSLFCGPNPEHRLQIAQHDGEVKGLPVQQGTA